MPLFRTACVNSPMIVITSYSIHYTKLYELTAAAPTTRVEVLGSVSDEAREALTQLNAVHFPHLGGFDR